MTNKAIRLLTLLPIFAFIFLTGCTPTPWRAAQNGDAAQLDSLLSSGQNIDEKSPGGDTALIFTAMKGDTEAARMLIDKGAKLDIQNSKGNTALILASSRGDTDIARMLIEKGADLDIQNLESDPPGGNTALLFSVAKGQLDIFRMLIDKGAKLDTQNMVGNTALIQAAATGRTDFARLLIDKGAKLDIQNKQGNVALSAAAFNGYADIVRMLIDKGAKIDTQNIDGNTVLRGAASKGHSDIVRILIDKGAKLDIQNKNGSTALDAAVKANNHAVAEMLRAAGAHTPSHITQPPASGSSVGSVTYTGTGWVTEGGYIVTNYHVIEGQIQLKVRFNSVGPEEYPASVVLSDQHNDLAILKVENFVKNKPKGIPIASKLPKIGAEVFTVGYPKSGVMGVNPKVTNGIISSLSGLQDDPRVIQTTAAIQSGNSGGPLLTMNGEVVGVITSTLRTLVSSKGVDVPQGVNYAVKSAYASALLSTLPEKSAYPMTIATNAKLEEIVPKIQNSIVQVIVKSNK